MSGFPSSQMSGSHHVHRGTNRPFGKRQPMRMTLSRVRMFKRMTGTCQGEGNWSMGSVLLAVASITKVSAARSANQSPGRDVAIRPSLTGRNCAFRHLLSYRSCFFFRRFPLCYYTISSERVALSSRSLRARAIDVRHIGEGLHLTSTTQLSRHC